MIVVRLFAVTVFAGASLLNAQTAISAQAQLPDLMKGLGGLYQDMKSSWVSQFTWTGRCDGMPANHPERDVCASLMTVWDAQRNGNGGWEPPNLNLFKPESIEVTVLGTKLNGNFATGEMQVTADCRHADPPVCPKMGASISTKAVVRLVYNGQAKGSWRLYDLSDKGHDAIALNPDEATTILKAKTNCPGYLFLYDAHYVNSRQETRIISPTKTGFFYVGSECSNGRGDHWLFIQNGSTWQVQ